MRRRLALDTDGAGQSRLAIDLTECYECPAAIESAIRTVWLGGTNLIVVADRIKGPDIASLAWHWQGHPDAAWWVEDGRAMLCLGETTMHIACPSVVLTPGDVDRIRGSRGHLTLTGRSQPEAVTWWVFALGDDSPRIEGAGRSIVVNGQTFELLQSGD